MLDIEYSVIKSDVLKSFDCIIFLMYHLFYVLKTFVLAHRNVPVFSTAYVR